jgi:hypothetical protein
MFDGILSIFGAAKKDSAGNEPGAATAASDVPSEPEAVTVGSSSGSEQAPDSRHLPRARLIEAQRLTTKKQGIDALIAITEQRLSDAKGREKLQRGYVLQTPMDSIAQAAHLDAITELQRQEAAVKSYKEAATELAAEITKLHELSEGEKETLAVKRQGIRELMLKCLELKRVACAQVEELRQALARVSEVTDEIETAAADLDLRPEGGFDSGPYERLLASLPGKDLLESTEKWCGWFLGAAEGRQLWIVRVPCLVLPECLTHSGVYSFGESVFSSDEEARELTCEDYSAGTRDRPWAPDVPKVMTPETYEKVLATAQEKGITPASICWGEDAERDRRERLFYIQNNALRLRKRRTIAPQDNIAFESNMMVTGRVTGNLTHNGRQYKVGELVQMPVAQAWSNLDALALGPP